MKAPERTGGQADRPAFNRFHACFADHIVHALNFFDFADAFFSISIWNTENIGEIQKGEGTTPKIATKSNKKPKPPARKGEADAPEQILTLQSRKISRALICLPMFFSMFSFSKQSKNLGKIKKQSLNRSIISDLIDGLWS